MSPPADTDTVLEARFDTAAELVADGSAAADAHPRVRVDRQDEPYRWRCPNGHTDWDKTNSHIWCRSCRMQNENGEDMDPEHYEIVDEKTDREIPWSAVELVHDRY